MLDAEGNALYVGKAKNLPKRVVNYTRPEKLPYRLQQMISLTISMEFMTTTTEAEALLLEANLIKKLKPRYNILLRDDKSFPYIFIGSDHDFPQITKHRGPQKRKGSYYGPFASAGDVNKTLSHLQKIFLLRPCADNVFSNRDRPCLEYQIKRCSAPCVKKVDQKDYAELVAEAKEFLSGKSSAVQKKLAQAMEGASADMDYEVAALLRDRIRALTQIQATQHINVASLGNADVIGVYQDDRGCCIQVFFFRGGQNFGNRSYFPAHTEEESKEDILSAFLAQFYQKMPVPSHILVSDEVSDIEVLSDALQLLGIGNVHITHPKRGEKVKLVEMAVQNAKEALQRARSEHASKAEVLEGVAEIFMLDSSPKRIEAYDNSHLMGTEEVGAMIVAGADGFMKNAYRRFTIRSTSENKAIQHGDDYAMMREVLTRRFLRLKKDDPEHKTDQWPDVVLIDGGAGQLSVVEHVFEELGITDVLCVGIAKGPDRNAGRERFFITGREPFMLPKNDPVLYYLQTLRDEVHRFAIGSHRKKRHNALTRSALDAIPGVGSKRKKALLSHFGSVKAIEQASADDLARVDGVSKKVAESIYNYLHNV